MFFVIYQGFSTMWHLRPYHVTLHQIFRIFSPPSDVDCEEIPLQLQVELIDLQYSQDLKSKFFVCHILDINKNHGLPPFGWFPNFITDTQQVVSMFGTTYCYEKLFTKMKHSKSMLHLQLSNYRLFDVLLLSTSSFNPWHDIILWLQTTSDVSLINYDCYLVN